MPRYIDIVGQTFNRLLVISFFGIRKRGAYWNCICDCGKTAVVKGAKLRSGWTRSCGCLLQEALKARRGPANHNWKGGRKRSGQGYIKILRPTHPNPDNMGYVPEHRLIMEEHLDRFLLPEETVHHKNGIRNDNRIENLELWRGKHSNEQRVYDRVLDAVETLQQYSPNLLSGLCDDTYY